MSLIKKVLCFTNYKHIFKSNSINIIKVIVLKNANLEFEALKIP